jgi:hypothetical protein
MNWPEPFGGIIFIALVAVTFVTGLVIAICGRELKRKIRKGINSNMGKNIYMRFVKDSGDLILLPKPSRDDSFCLGPITKKR